MRRVVLLLALLAVFPCALRADDALALRVVYEETPNPPRHLGTGSLVPDPPGITVDILRLVAERLDLELKLLRAPWERGLFMVEHGEADAIFHASFKPERLAIGVYPMANDLPDESRAIFFQNYSFYVRADSGVSWDGSELAGAERPVGATTGYSVVADLEGLGLDVETERSAGINFRKLESGRIDAYAELQTMADAFLAENGGTVEGIVRLQPPIVEKAYYLMLSHQFYEAHPDIAEAIWDEIAAINGSADYETIADRYRNGE